MLDTLTDREKEVLELACKNKTNVEIADLIGMTEHTVKKDLRAIYAKLGIGVGSSSEAHQTRRKMIFMAQSAGIQVEMEEAAEKKFSIVEIRRIAKELFPDQRIRVVNELLSTLNIME